MQADGEHRSGIRSNVFLTAVLIGGEEPRPVRVRNLSPGGAFLDGKEIDVAAWVKRVGHSGQRQVDETVAALRHHQLPAASTDAPSLVRISAELDGICERISASPSMTVEVGEELVRLDALARALQQIARDAGGFTQT